MALHLSGRPAEALAPLAIGAEIEIKTETEKRQKPNEKQLTIRLCYVNNIDIFPIIFHQDLTQDSDKNHCFIPLPSETLAIFSDGSSAILLYVHFYSRRVSLLFANPSQTAS